MRYSIAMAGGNLLIDGQWRGAHEKYQTLSPATGESLADVDLASSGDVAEAVAAARRAQKGWQRLGVDRRIEVLAGFLSRLREAYGNEGERTSLKSLISEEVGKRIPEADIEVAESGDMVEYFINEAPPTLGIEELKLDQGLWPNKSSVVTLQPVGVVAVIKPWNYPLELPIWSIVPALVAGNSVVFKPAAESSLVGVELARMLSEDLPPGVFNLLTGGARTGRDLVEADVDMVAFTGSGEVGQEIAIKAAPRMIRCTLELGGNDPALIEPDVDLELAANGLVWGCFSNAGQVCVRPKRVLVHDDIADALLDLIQAKTMALRPDVDWAPMISEGQLKKASRQIDQTVEQGALVVAGNKRLARPGFYFEPTVLDRVTPQMTVAQEECFAPVMPFMRVASMEEACAIANDTRYGLGASVWSGNRERATRTAQNLEAGMVWINDVNVAFPQAPWGGVKGSGIGSELGKWGIQEFIRPRHLSIERSDESRRDWWFPYPDDE
jgi:acyl-CoA reductase-like NAD-dependent aldehyde dehydrogenase